MLLSTDGIYSKAAAAVVIHCSCCTKRC